MKPITTIVTGIALLLPLVCTKAQPFVTDATTSIYAVVPDPMRIAFAPDGTLYAGRDASGSGGGSADAVKIHRIAPGGSPVTEFGELAISDPDAVIVDVAGTVSGTPGAVLVGGVHPGGTTGKIVKIAPDGTVTILFGPDASILNPTHFIFDSAGRLLFTENNNGRVMVSTGGMPTNLFALTGAAYIAEDAAGRLVVSSTADNRLRLYNSAGGLLNNNFAQAKIGSPLACAPGGIWGTDLYAVAGNGDLLRVTLSGETNRVGRGFGNIVDLRFGPDGALYASDFSGDRIYRFALPAVPDAQTTIYARVADPVRISFAPDGAMFVGRDNTGSGGTHDDPVKVHRIGPGGSPVEEYGNTSISDPDGVFYDAAGRFTGTPGAVIVGGMQTGSQNGKLVQILSDGTVAPLYGPTTFAFNPNVFVLDGLDRLLFSDDEGGKVWVMTNTTPMVLFTLTKALHLAADSANRLVVGVNGQNTLRLYDSQGTLLTNAFATCGTNSPLALGPGGFWGTGIFCVNTNGDLLSLDTNGVATKVGTGFGAPLGMSFGPDGALYVSDFEGDLIWRISAAAPRLAIFRTTTNSVVVSWPLAETEGWVLQATNALPNVAAPWPVILPPYQTNGPNLQFIEPAPTGNKFYRLHKP